VSSWWHDEDQASGRRGQQRDRSQRQDPKNHSSHHDPRLGQSNLTIPLRGALSSTGALGSRRLLGSEVPPGAAETRTLRTARKGASVRRRPSSLPPQYRLQTPAVLKPPAHFSIWAAGMVALTARQPERPKCPFSERTGGQFCGFWGTTKRRRALVGDPPTSPPTIPHQRPLACGGYLVSLDAGKPIARW
jgi:hypothetical protein